MPRSGCMRAWGASRDGGRLAETSQLTGSSKAALTCENAAMAGLQALRLMGEEEGWWVVGLGWTLQNAACNGVASFPGLNTPGTHPELPGPPGLEKGPWLACVYLPGKGQQP